MINLMHVEDDPDIREIARMALQMSGDFHLWQFSSGSAAVAGAAKINPDAILLDVMMPGMSGQQTLLRLRSFAHLEQVPAIFMTARARQSEQDALRDLGGAAVITKPFDPLTLPDQIKNVLKARTGIEEKAAAL